jgi:hypothetical protein
MKNPMKDGETTMKPPFLIIFIHFSIGVIDDNLQARALTAETELTATSSAERADSSGGAVARQIGGLVVRENLWKKSLSFHVFSRGLN